MSYRLAFTNENPVKVNLRKIFLTIAVCLDVADIFMVLEAAFSSLYWLFGVFASLAASIAARYFSRRIIKTFEYEFRDGVFEIRRAIPYKSENICRVDCLRDSFELIPIKEINAAEKAEKCFFCCDLDLYMLKFDGKNFAVRLDDYMYALIDRVRNDGQNLS